MAAGPLSHLWTSPCATLVAGPLSPSGQVHVVQQLAAGPLSHVWTSPYGDAKPRIVLESDVLSSVA